MGFLTELKHPVFSRLAGEQALRHFLYLSPCAGVTGKYSLAQFYVVARDWNSDPRTLLPTEPCSQLQFKVLMHSHFVRHMILYFYVRYLKT